MRLGPGITTPSVSQAKTVPFELDPDEILLPIFKDMVFTEKASSVWLDSLYWDNETSIRNIVQKAVDDCISAISLNAKLRTAPEKLFTSVDAKKRDRTDLALVKMMVTSLMIGAIEVKKPPNEEQRYKGIEFDMNDAGQLVQYMVDLRSNFGVRFVFGILTTYVKWRFFWLEDSDEAMQCNSRDEFQGKCQRSPPNTPVDSPANEDDTKNVVYAVIPNKLRIKKSRVYNYDDKDLVGIICTLLMKWAYIPCDNVQGYLHPNRLFQTAKFNREQYEFLKLPSEIQSFSYVFPPHGRVQRLYFLHVYQRTGDGKVALWTTSSGRIGVAKFFIHENNHEQKLVAKKEQKHWKDFWGVDTIVKYMFNRHVMLMPFVFHIRQYANELRFCPMSRWNFRWQSTGDYIPPFF